MTVAELRKALEAFPEDQEVAMEGRYAFFGIGKIRIEKADAAITEGPQFRGDEVVLLERLGWDAV